MRLLPLFLSLLAPAATAQLSQPGTPASIAETLPGELPQHVLDGPDVAAYLAEDEENGPFPFRYGAILETSVDIASAGRWDETATHLVWRTEIASPGALRTRASLSRSSRPIGSPGGGGGAQPSHSRAATASAAANLRRLTGPPAAAGHPPLLSSQSTTPGPARARLRATTRRLHPR